MRRIEAAEVDECPYCYALVMPDRFRAHIAAAHKTPLEPPPWLPSDGR